jgi:hypothetical protein
VSWESAPVVVAASIAIASAVDGSLRVTAAVVAAWAAYTAVQRAVFGRRALRARQAAEIAQADAQHEMFMDAESIATLLAVIGSPANQSDVRQTQKQLIATVLESAARCCGLTTDSRPRTEASFYVLAGPPYQLIRNQVTSGYGVTELPGSPVAAQDPPVPNCMVGHAVSGAGVLVERLSGSAAGMVVRAGVPVGSQGVPRGILFVETTDPAAIVQLGEHFLTFLAGALAAGLTLLGDEIKGSMNYAESTGSTAGSERAGHLADDPVADVKEADDD